MGAVSTNKKSNAGKNVLVFFIVFIILEMLIIFGVGKIFKNPDVTPSVAGYSIYMTHDDLKSKKADGGYEVAVPKDVLVIASEGLADAKNKIGSAVLCENIKGADVKSGVFWLAEVKTVEGVDGVTYTVANGNKYYTVKSSNVVGVTASYFVTAGKVISFITSKFGMIACAVVPLFLLVLIELIIAIATHEPDDEDDDEEEEEEEKNVELDDFLFGGQSEGEQIARLRQQQAEPEEEPAKTDDSNVDLTDIDIDFKAAKAAQTTQTAAEEPAAPAEPAVTPAEEPVKNEYYEKASKLLDGEPAGETAAPAEAEPVRKPRPAQQRPAQRRRPQNRRPAQRPAKTASTGNASLEDLMKLMEEEQNKLNKLK